MEDCCKPIFWFFPFHRRVFHVKIRGLDCGLLLRFLYLYIGYCAYLIYLKYPFNLHKMGKGNKFVACYINWLFFQQRLTFGLGNVWCLTPNLFFFFFLVIQIRSLHRGHAILRTKSSDNSNLCAKLDLITYSCIYVLDGCISGFFNAPHHNHIPQNIVFFKKLITTI